MHTGKQAQRSVAFFGLAWLLITNNTKKGGGLKAERRPTTAENSSKSFSENHSTFAPSNLLFVAEKAPYKQA
jgi:hypothetical protein